MGTEWKPEEGGWDWQHGWDEEGHHFDSGWEGTENPLDWVDDQCGCSKKCDKCTKCWDNVDWNKIDWESTDFETLCQNKCTKCDACWNDCYPIMQAWDEEWVPEEVWTDEG